MARRNPGLRRSHSTRSRQPAASRTTSSPIFRDHLASVGRSAFHQLCTVTDDFDGKLAGFAALGYETVSEFHAEGQRVAFADTVEDRARGWLAELAVAEFVRLAPAKRYGER